MSRALLFSRHSVECLSAVGRVVERAKAITPIPSMNFKLLQNFPLVKKHLTKLWPGNPLLWRNLKAKLKL